MRLGGWVGAAATTALRRSSLDELESGVARYLDLVDRTGAGSGDPRDVMVGLAPFVDCARRLGADPVALFDRAAERVAPELAELAELVRTFVRREDISLTVFGWVLEESPAGPEYGTA